MAERFHIGEWYGKPFLDLTDSERLALADHKVGGSAMTKVEIDRMVSLEEKQAVQSGLTASETKRLEVLHEKLEVQRREEMPCPFRTDSPHPTCTKPGGVCSLQLLSDNNGSPSGITGERGMVRALCPYRFHQENTIFKHIGQRLLQDESPEQVGEVGFLESTGNLDSAAGTDVGYIDMILVSHPPVKEIPLRWAAVEIQAVYFSGPEMSAEFRHLKETAGALSMAKEGRRPDYRSSGPKRLMPQLQIKVPTLRRWGKKMAVVVDVPFFRSMGTMATVSHVSNADIVWFLVDFPQTTPGTPRKLVVVEEIYTTLEAAIDGLTGGVPIALDEFQTRIVSKPGA
jgi:hypothetical protein